MRNCYPKWVLIVVLSFLGATSSQIFAEPKADSHETRAKILEALGEVHTKQQNVGLSCAVLHDGTIVFSETLGFADVQRRQLVENETQFLVASVTKAFTGAALLKLYEQGQIDLDAPIQVYVPDFFDKPGPPITPRLLAAHIAGIRHYRSDEKSHEFLSRHYDNVLDALVLFKDDSLLFEPGTDYQYTSYGYNLLAAAIQGAAGKPFREVVEELIFDPLDLSNTVLHDVRTPAPSLTKHYTYYVPFEYEEVKEPQLVPQFDYSYNMGGGNIATTAEDLVRFGRAFLEPGFFSEQTWPLLFKPTATEHTWSPWSFGWFVSNPDSGRRSIYITGAFVGAQAGLRVYPDDDLVVAVLSNTWGVGSRSAEMVIDLPKRIAAIVLGD